MHVHPFVITIVNSERSGGKESERMRWLGWGGPMEGLGFASVIMDLLACHTSSASLVEVLACSVHDSLSG